MHLARLCLMLAEHAQARDASIADVAPSYSAVQLPPSKLGWRWHPWLGFTVKR